MKKFLKISLLVVSIPVLFFIGILLFDNGKLQYEERIEIEKPIDVVVDLFGDINNMKKYMPETKDIILLEGTDGEEGAKYLIVVEYEGETMEMTSTLLEKKLPEKITYSYESNGVLNIMTQKHQKSSDNTTLVINEQQFEFRGLLKIISFFEPEGFSPESFKQRSRLYLQSFKKFVETN